MKRVTVNESSKFRVEAVNYDTLQTDGEDTQVTCNETKQFCQKSFIVLTMLNVNLAFEAGVLIPTLWPYIQTFGKSESSYGLVISCYLGGKIMGTLPISILTDKFGLRIMLLLTTLLSFLGNLVYALASYPDTFPLLLVGRLLSGIGSGVQPLIYHYVTYAPKEDQKRHMSFLITNYVSGLIFAPCMNLLFPYLEFTFSFFTFNTMTYSGYCPGLFSFILFLVLLFLFEDPEEPQRLLQPFRISAVRNFLDKTGAYYNLIWIFACGFLTVWSESSLSPVLMNYLGYDIHWVSLFCFLTSFCILGAAGTISFLTKRKNLEQPTMLEIGPYLFLLVCFIGYFPEIWKIGFENEAKVLNMLAVNAFSLAFNSITGTGVFVSLLTDCSFAGSLMCMYKYLEMFGAMTASINLGLVLQYNKSAMLWYLPFGMLPLISLCAFYPLKTRLRKMHEKMTTAKREWLSINHTPPWSPSATSSFASLSRERGLSQLP